MVRYGAVCELNCQQIIVIYYYIACLKKKYGYFQSKQDYISPGAPATN